MRCLCYGKRLQFRLVVDCPLFLIIYGKEVLSYQLWTPEWTKLLQASKFSEKSWPSAFALLNNCGGANHEGFIGLQDHGNDVWYRNICIKVLK